MVCLYHRTIALGKDDNAWWLFDYVVRHGGESAISSDLLVFWRHIQAIFRPSCKLGKGPDHF